MRARLTVETGVADPQTLELDAEAIRLGRNRRNSMVLQDQHASRWHAEIYPSDGRWFIRDRDTTNGTKLNGAPLTSEHTVMPDDELSIANHIFTIDYEPGAPTAVLKNRGIVDEEMSEAPRKHSLMELAGLDTDDDRPRKRRPARE